MYFVYEPVTGPCGEEIPAYTIYRDGEPLAFTDTGLSREEQEQAAQIYLAAHLMVENLTRLFEAGALHPGAPEDRP